MKYRTEEDLLQEICYNPRRFQGLSVNQLKDELGASWQKIVLKLKPSDDDFDKFIELWDELDAKIRSKIMRTADMLDENSRTLFLDLNRRFFVEADLE